MILKISFLTLISHLFTLQFIDAQLYSMTSVENLGVFFTQHGNMWNSEGGKQAEAL